jgi:hypothetical protein
MSVSLLKYLCTWILLNCETTYGVFCHCVLLMTWNLGCWFNHTMLIKVHNICWSQCFNCFHVIFAHLKTDQIGNYTSYPRHIFCNPTDPIVCPILSLAMYFTCCCILRVGKDDFLFLGLAQEVRFSITLAEMPKQLIL